MEGRPGAFEPSGRGHPDQPREGDPKPARGGCLTALLIAMLVANAATAIAYFADPVAVTQSAPNFSEEIGLLLGVCAVLNALFAVLVFQWRRIGLYGIAVTASVAFAVNLHLGLPIEVSLIGLAGPVMLGALVLPHWAQFR